MSAPRDVWAVVPIKEATDAKQRLAGALASDLRRRLALAMAEDVLVTLATADGLSGIIVVTVDSTAAALAERCGARVVADGARDGQTGAVTAAARLLVRERKGAMLTIPGDVPLITAQEILALITAHDRSPDFVIAPAHDGRGSNAILCAPPDHIALKFGDDSFLPHLAAARQAGIEPTILRLPGVALDIDHPRDLAAFLKVASTTRARALLDAAGLER